LKAGGAVAPALVATTSSAVRRATQGDTKFRKEGLIASLDRTLDLLINESSRSKVIIQKWWQPRLLRALSD
jgi:hypothetical protein